MAGYSVIGFKRKVTSSSVLAFIVESSKEDLERKLWPIFLRKDGQPLHLLRLSEWTHSVSVML